MNKKGRKMELHSSKLVMDNASSAVVCHVIELVRWFSVDFTQFKCFEIFIIFQGLLKKIEMKNLFFINFRNLWKKISWVPIAMLCS